MATKNTSILGSLEKIIMEMVWQSHQPLTVKQVFQSISKKHPVAYTTVMTVMTRLTEKGVLTRSFYKTSYLYKPKLSREKFIARSAHDLFSAVVSNFGEEAVAHFIKEIKKISPQKRRELLKILNH